MKKGCVFLVSLSVFLVFLVAFVFIYYFGANYKDFYSIASKEFKIPGLETKFVPQGMDYDQNNQYFLISGYMSNGTSSRIYFVDKQSGNTIKYITLKVDNEDYLGHAGGIAVSGNYAFVVGDGYLYRINYLSALQLGNGESLAVLDKLQTGNGADFVLTYQNKLIVGEFYKKKKYETPQFHHYSTTSGETNYAMSYVYEINHSKLYGLENTTPSAVISMPNQVQGMSFTKDGDIILSTSYSIPSSKLYVYENVLNSTPASITINNSQKDLYVLCNNNLKSTMKAPAMSEELVLVEDKVFVLFESSCSKYKYFNRTRLSNVYALNI